MKQNDYIFCQICGTILYQDEVHECPNLTVMKHITYHPVPRIDEQQKESNEQDS